MITKNFQKLGALVASLVGILTLSSAAEAITFTSSGGATVGKTPSTAIQDVTTAEINNPLTIDFVTSVTINGLQIEKNARRLSATLSLRNASGDDIVTPVALFSSSGITTTGPGITSGSFTFVDAIASAWPVGAAPYPAGTYKSEDSFSVFNGLDLNGTYWAFNLTNAANNTSGTASFTNFSIDVAAAAVPFESNAAPAGVAIVFGAFVLRRKLQQRSAQNMSLESVNS